MDSPIVRLLRRRRVSPRPWQNPSSQGFALPLALGGALLLLLSSGSLQLLALQNRARLSQLHQRQQVEDLLASAAQQQLAALQQAGAGCLVGVDREAWDQAAAACGITALQRQALENGQLGANRYRLIAYRLNSASSTATSADLELQLSGQRSWRAAYRVRLVPAADGGLQIAAVQELGLRGNRA